MLTLSRRGLCHIHVPSFLLAVVLFAFLPFLFQRRQTLISSADDMIHPGQHTLKVAVINTPLSHDEVIVPLMEAWMDVPHTSVLLYQAGYRFGMDVLLEQQNFPAAMRDEIHIGDFRKIGQDPRYPLPDIIVSTTCMNDITLLKENFTMLLEQHHTHLFCVIHHADRMQEEKWAMESTLSPWVRAERIDFITLSPHVADFTRRERMHRHWKVVKDELHQPRIRVFPPVFQFDAPPGRTTGASREAGFAIQGEYQRGRDYKTVFDHLRTFIQAAKDRGQSADEINLHLVGFGKHPDVPPELQNNVVFDERLDYIDYYMTLVHTEAVLTAFDNDEYYHVKASSSVPAALIAGTPLIADEELMKAYSYLDKSVVWWRNEGESELEAVGRVLAMSREDREQKKALVRKFTENLIRENKKAVKQWTAEAVQQFPAQWYLP